ncbi:MAG: cob(I)yrinic acid a,c-diamide adenosyltransferase [Candidatus Micrarchaeota archaeon]|nr:cob(I)yrinic acid a,c-diamide adenosyltransferase [Candidatus Micrarchaeota archaeon]MDE1849675.1 cob(I)yrinic acid a,c-diamide adenosyltransferase [Candidatus Micrarchaeota archaeon]
MTDYYTGKGDSGSTGILASGRLSKGDDLIEAIGCADELNSSIGIALFYIHDDQIRIDLKMVQNDLFIIGANLASLNSDKVKKAKFDSESIVRLEEKVKHLGRSMPELKEFVLPGGSEGSVHLHLSRTIARRAERSVVRASANYAIDKTVLAYLNRLSSFLFVVSLYLNFKEGIGEQHPTY